MVRTVLITPTADQKSRLYEQGAYRFSAPGVCTVYWDKSAWCDWIDAGRGWMLAKYRAVITGTGEELAIYSATMWEAEHYIKYTLGIERGYYLAQTGQQAALRDIQQAADEVA